MPREIALVESGSIRGSLHEPDGKARGHVTLAHGAGSNRDAPLLVSIARVFCEAGFAVLRCDLNFRQKRAFGPPLPAWAKADQEGLREAVQFMRQRFKGMAVLGGHSYGGRQATLAAAENAGVADMLLLLSYPLHPPRKPEQPRTAHWPALQTPALFAHGTRDPFGSIDEMRGALRLIRPPVEMLICEGAGHDLSPRRPATADQVRAAFDRFLLRLR